MSLRHAVRRLGRAAVERAADVKEMAVKHEADLAEFYPSFKDILAGGWKLLSNAEVEGAVQFALDNKPKKKMNNVSCRA